MEMRAMQVKGRESDKVGRLRGILGGGKWAVLSVKILLTETWPFKKQAVQWFQENISL